MGEKKRGGKWAKTAGQIPGAGDVFSRSERWKRVESTVCDENVESAEVESGGIDGIAGVFGGTRKEM